MDWVGVIDLGKQAAKLVSDLVGTMAAIKELLSRDDAGDTAVEERIAEAGAKGEEIEKVLLDLTQQNTALIHAHNGAEKQIVELERQLAKAHDEVSRMRDWEAMRASYTLTHFLKGTAAMVFDPAVTGSKEPVHKLCPNCFNEGKKSFFSFQQEFPGVTISECPFCKTRLCEPNNIPRPKRRQIGNSYMD